jgi:Na+/melibiose symporter-like transporter
MFGAAYAPTYLTLFETIPLLLAIAVQPTVGTISDYTISRWGRRKPYIVIGALLDVVFLYGFASSNVLIVMFAFIMLLQFSSNFAQGPFQGYVPDLVPKEQVGSGQRLMGVMIVIGQGLGVGIAALGLIQLNGSPYPGRYGRSRPVRPAGLPLPTVGLAVVEVVTMVPLVLFVREGARRPRATAARGSDRPVGVGPDILRQRSYVWMLVSRLFFLMAPTLPLSLGLFFLRQSLGSTDEQAGCSSSRSSEWSESRPAWRRCRRRNCRTVSGART